jgi:orotidine-5'-phosphate decarboxylase
MDKAALFQQIKIKKSFLCVGLDTDIQKIPTFLLKESDPVYAFNKAIIDASADFTVAYKPNTAFYEEYGAKGWLSLEKTIDYIRSNYPEIFIIADAKRGDIGNTSAKYASAFFDELGADAVTVAPYMGHDSVLPFLNHKDKWVILLALTSNAGSADFQYLTSDNKKLFERVLETAKSWADPDQLMFVVGATHPEEIALIRKIVPDYFLLVPGVGAQGGDLQAVAEFGLNNECGLLVNSSRGIIYRSDKEDFAVQAGIEAQKIQQEMETILFQKGLV